MEKIRNSNVEAKITQIKSKVLNNTNSKIKIKKMHLSRIIMTEAYMYGNPFLGYAYVHDHCYLLTLVK
jgi:hypothetical protein